MIGGTPPADNAAMRLGYLLGDGQPETDALGLAGHERIKDAVGDVCGGTGSGVIDFEDSGPCAVCAPGMKQGFNPAAGPGCLDGVAENVKYQLFELAAIALKCEFLTRRLPAKVDACVTTLRLEQGLRLVNQSG